MRLSIGSVGALAPRKCPVVFACLEYGPSDFFFEPRAGSFLEGTDRLSGPCRYLAERAGQEKCELSAKACPDGPSSGS